MANKYFRREADDLIYRIIETQDLMGQEVLYAVQMDSNTADILTDGVTQTGWEEVREDGIKIDNFYIDVETDEYGMTEEDYQSMADEESRPSGQTLKQMLEGLRSRPDWDDMNRHERLRAGLDQSGKNLNRAEDVLGMIRARQANEMPPTVILNPSKYTDSKTLESALETIRKKDSEANIWVGTVPADDLLATLKNQETIGLSSVPDPTKPLGLTLDQETLDLIKKLGPKK
jgi:hypothetical protein